MGHRRFRTWSPRLAIMSTVIVTGVMVAPIARAENGIDLGVPTQAAVATAVADAVAVQASMLSESQAQAVSPAPVSPPPPVLAADGALQLVSPDQGTTHVVAPPSQQSPPAI